MQLFSEACVSLLPGDAGKDIIRSDRPLVIRHCLAAFRRLLHLEHTDVHFEVMALTLFGRLLAAKYGRGAWGRRRSQARAAWRGSQYAWSSPTFSAACKCGCQQAQRGAAPRWLLQVHTYPGFDSHCGLGSTSSAVIAVLAGANECLGSPLGLEAIRLLAGYNFVEEEDAQPGFVKVYAGQWGGD